MKNRQRFAFYYFLLCPTTEFNLLVRDYASSSRPRMFFEKVLKILAIFTGKHLCWSLFFNNVAGLMPGTLLRRDSNAGVYL